MTDPGAVGPPFPRPIVVATRLVDAAWVHVAELVEPNADWGRVLRSVDQATKGAVSAALYELARDERWTETDRDFLNALAMEVG